MERILTVEQMRSADKFTIESLGVDEEVLVLRAGNAVAEEIIKRFYGGRVLICMGNGNNGADGRVIADVLSKKHGFSVSCINVSNGIYKLFDKKYDIIIDCIFGTGLNRNVEGKYKTAIEKINSSGAYVISCDIPSGLNGNTGIVQGIAVNANLTVAIQELKLGHFLNSGPDYCGEIVCKDIGISIWGDDYVKKLNNESLKYFFKPNKRLVNKGDLGKCCIIGGSKDYSGSVILSANALSAFKMGIGYVNVVVPDSLLKHYIGYFPECILTPIKDQNGKLLFDKETLDKVLSYDSIAIGMGLGVSESVYNTIKYLLNNYKGNLLIDADGLNSLSKYGCDILKEKTCNVILTPHIKEFCRLANIDKNNLLENSINIATDFARHNRVVLLLKNAVSIITDGNETYLNITGCSGMAKAGSGDVLSGLTCGLLARCDVTDILRAVATSAYIFGMAGEIAQSKQNEFCMTPSDVINELAPVINSFR